MLEISTKEFLTNPERYLLGAAVNGDFVKVRDKTGSTILVSEAEWNIMRDALRTLLSADNVLPLDSPPAESEPAISDHEMSDLMREKNKAKRNAVIDNLTEDNAKHFLKRLLSVMNRHTEY